MLFKRSQSFFVLELLCFIYASILGTAIALSFSKGFSSSMKCSNKLFWPLLIFLVGYLGGFIPIIDRIIRPYHDQLPGIYLLLLGISTCYMWAWLFALASTKAKS